MWVGKVGVSKWAISNSLERHSILHTSLCLGLNINTRFLSRKNYTTAFIHDRIYISLVNYSLKEMDKKVILASNQLLSTKHKMKRTIIWGLILPKTTIVDLNWSSIFFVVGWENPRDCPLALLNKYHCICRTVWDLVRFQRLKKVVALRNMEEIKGK